MICNAMVVDDYWTQILLNEVHTPWQCTIGVPKALVLCIHDMDNSFLGCWCFTSGVLITDALEARALARHGPQLQIAAATSRDY